MPIFVSPPKSSYSNIDCNSQNPATIPMERTAIDSTDDLIKWFKNFDKKTKQEIPKGEAGKLIKYANFQTESLLPLVQTPGCVFVRVFNATMDDGQNIMFIVPFDADMKPIKGINTIYLEQCCACPPSCHPNGDLDK